MGEIERCRAAGCNVVVATPGRLLDVLRRNSGSTGGALDVKSVEVRVNRCLLLSGVGGRRHIAGAHAAGCGCVVWSCGMSHTPTRTRTLRRCWCSTRRTRCWTWASPTPSVASSRCYRNSDERVSSPQHRCAEPAAFAASCYLHLDHALHKYFTVVVGCRDLYFAMMYRSAQSLADTRGKGSRTCRHAQPCRRARRCPAAGDRC